MNRFNLIIVILMASLVTACQKKQEEPTPQQKSVGKEIRKGKFDKSSGKTW